MSQTMTTEEMKRRRETGERLQIADVRSPGEYAAGHIPGAVNLPMDQIEARLDDLHPTDPVVLVCQSGKRATLTGELLRARRPDLWVLEGGTDAWTGAALPVVRSAASRWSLERQVRLGAGLLALTGAVLAVTVHPAWIALSGFVGLGLTFAGLTNFCPMASLLARMPWNRARRTEETPYDTQAAV